MVHSTQTSMSNQMDAKQAKPQPHVLILPFPAQGHIKPMLCLAELLCLASIGRVTFLNSQLNHNRLSSTTIKDFLARFSALNFESISDGLSEDHPRTIDHSANMLTAINNVTRKLFREMMLSYSRSSNPITCIIGDGIMSFVFDVAEEFNVPLIVFRTASACHLWSFYCVPKLIEDGQIPFAEEDMDRGITGVQGLEGIARCRDLPSFVRLKEDDFMFYYLVQETKKLNRASALILNTFDDLEAPILSHIGQVIKTYTIGPLHSLVKSYNSESQQFSPLSKGSLWEADRTCMAWLDSQPPKSVIYVSFGSLVRMSKEQILELWYGLKNSGIPFMWVIRPDMIPTTEGGESSLREELDGGSKKGCIVNWAPQEEVLAHRAVGGFLTHNGWNSTLEAIIAGVPMICWPQFGDQQTNSRWVSKVWNIGFDMKDTCDRLIIEKMVRDLMENNREEVSRSISEVSRMAKDCVKRGGSSFKNLEKLIEQIRSTC